MNRAREANNFAPIGILLLGFTPALMVLLPWDFGNEMTFYRGFMRGNSLPVTIVEFAFLLLAMARGFSPVAAVSSLPELTKSGLALFSSTVLWTTLFVAESSISATLGMIKLFAHLMFGLAFAHQLAGWTADQRRLIWLAIGLGVVTYVLFWGINIAFYDPVGDDWVNLVPALTNIRWIGFFTLASFCAGIGLLATNSGGDVNSKRFLIALAFGSLGLTIAFWTGTRGALVAILVAATLTSLAFGLWRQIMLFSSISVAVAIAVATPLPIVHKVYGIDRIIGASKPSDGVAGMSSGRVQIWIDTLEKIGQRPVAGWGIDQFRLSFPENMPGYFHPHQGVLQLLFSSGVLGALAMLMIVIPFLRLFPRKLEQPYQRAATAYLFGAVAYGLYDGFFYYTYPVMLTLVAVACVIVPPPSAADRLD